MCKRKGSCCGGCSSRKEITVGITQEDVDQLYAVAIGDDNSVSWELGESIVLNIVRLEYEDTSGN